MSKLESLVVEEPNALNSGGTKSVLCTLRHTLLYHSTNILKVGKLQYRLLTFPL